MPKRQQVKTLVPAGDLPPAAAVQRFVTFYVNERDLKTAACRAGLDPKMGERLYKEEKVRTAIDRKILLVDIEEAKVKAQANLLTVDRLDSALYEEVKSKKNGHIRVRAIELGYRRTGLIRDGEFYVAPDPNSNKNAPSIYQSRQLTMKRTVTEEVTQTVATAAIPPAPSIFSVKEY